MARALQDHAALQLLDLSGCGVSAATCSVLVEALASCASLRSLLLRDNPLGRAGGRRVLRALQQGAACMLVMVLQLPPPLPLSNSGSGCARAP